MSGRRENSRHFDRSECYIGLEAGSAALCGSCSDRHYHEQQRMIFQANTQARKEPVQAATDSQSCPNCTQAGGRSVHGLTGPSNRASDRRQRTPKPQRIRPKRIMALRMRRSKHYHLSVTFGEQTHIRQSIMAAASTSRSVFQTLTTSSARRIVQAQTARRLAAPSATSPARRFLR